MADMNDNIPTDSARPSEDLFAGLGARRDVDLGRAVATTRQKETRNVWRGKNYDKRRLLLLGESTYSWKEDGKIVHPSSRHAIELVEGQCDGSWPNRFMNKLSRGLTRSENPTLDDIAAAWDGVAFTNYVDETVGLDRKKRPTAEMWQRARERFPSILAELRPRAIIVLGKVMWSQMPDTQLEVLGDLQAYRHSARGGLAWCWTVDHPASRYHPLSWRRLARVIGVAEAATDIVEAKAKLI
jgi:hypothetical protein